MSTRLLIAYGGASSEHEISIRSARSILAAVDRTRMDPILLAIRRDGGFRTGPADADLAAIVQDGQPVTDLAALRPDLVFPVVHGPGGEDGTLQGYLEIVGLPYVGSGVLASALCMDKVLQKQLVAAAAPEIPLVPWVAAESTRAGDPTLHAEIADRLGFPCFVKPVNLGSSVGVSRVASAGELPAALLAAAAYDTRVIVERGVDGAREIEIAVLGNGGPDTVVSAPGEIGLPPGVWYDYETKYERDVATLHIPAALPDDTAAAIAAHARTAFSVTGCKGLARIDFLLDRSSGVAYLNELNTMPGFTSISMYPKLMEHAGVPYPELVSRLCALAQSCHDARRRLSKLR